MAKILVVDDQRNMRTTLAMMLRGAGHEVDEADDGDMAIDRIAAEVYDLVLTDLKMGGTDGMAVLRNAKETSQLTEVIVMTAYGTLESGVAAIKARTPMVPSASWTAKRDRTRGPPGRLTRATTTSL